MENNPYAAPGAVVDDVPAFRGDELEARKASRGQRFGAAFLDGLLGALCTVPLYMYVLAAQGKTTPFAASGPILGICGLLGLVVIVINCMLLHRNGQTIGKRALGIKTVRKDGSRVELTRFIFIRWLPVTLLGLIPFVGGLVGLVDACMIFGNEKRCLHDLIADTIVIED
jgi:uncharacterized RDD family membrane protein YckC